jgi:hypothetical protein
MPKVQVGLVARCVPVDITSAGISFLVHSRGAAWLTPYATVLFMPASKCIFVLCALSVKMIRGIFMPLGGITQKFASFAAWFYSVT